MCIPDLCCCCCCCCCCFPASMLLCRWGKTAQELKDRFSLNSFYLNGADGKQYYYTHLQVGQEITPLPREYKKILALCTACVASASCLDTQTSAVGCLHTETWRVLHDMKAALSLTRNQARKQPKHDVLSSMLGMALAASCRCVQTQHGGRARAVSTDGQLSTEVPLCTAGALASTVHTNKSTVCLCLIACVQRSGQAIAVCVASSWVYICCTHHLPVYFHD
jgi:hypothetical protein